MDKLKQKLRENLTGQLSDEKTEVDVNIACKIAEEFAIEFGEWLDSLTEEDMGGITITNLLKFFKDEIY